MLFSILLFFYWRIKMKFIFWIFKSCSSNPSQSCSHLIPAKGKFTPCLQCLDLSSWIVITQWKKNPEDLDDLSNICPTMANDANDDAEGRPCLPSYENDTVYCVVYTVYSAGGGFARRFFFFSPLKGSPLQWECLPSLPFLRAGKGNIFAGFVGKRGNCDEKF